MGVVDPFNGLETLTRTPLRCWGNNERKTESNTERERERERERESERERERQT